MRAIAAERMQAHVAVLCTEHGVTIERLNRAGRGRARKRERTIEIAPIRSGITYLVALHELAHVIGPEQTSRHRRIVQEIAAWEYALELNQFRLTPGMRRAISRKLASYVIKYCRLQRAWIPSPYSDGAERQTWERMAKLLALGHDPYARVIEAIERSRRREGLETIGFDGRRSV